MILRRVKTADLLPPKNPVRASIDETSLAELTDDISRNGVRIPLHVKIEFSKFRVVAGHRRMLAAKAAGIDTVPVLILSGVDGTVELTMLTENLFRQELTPVEEGGLFAELYEKLENDIDKVCAQVGKSRAYVETRLNLLEGDADVLSALAAREISMSVAAELNRIGDPRWRKYYLGYAVQQGAKAELVRFWRQTANGQGPMIEQPDAPPPAAPAHVPTPEEVMICVACRQPDRKYEMGVAMIHHDCRAALITALDNAAADAAGIPREVEA
jgi:ParB/RepB/Spo0J family partition protein